MLGLKQKNRLKTDCSAVYVIGRFQFAPIVMFGVNPGYSLRNSPIEEDEAKKMMATLSESLSEFFSILFIQ